MRAAMGCPAVPVVLGELGYFLDVADPRFVHAAAVNAGMLKVLVKRSGIIVPITKFLP